MKFNIKLHFKIRVKNIILFYSIKLIYYYNNNFRIEINKKKKRKKKAIKENNYILNYDR